MPDPGVPAHQGLQDNGGRPQEAQQLHGDDLQRQLPLGQEYQGTEEHIVEILITSVLYNRGHFKLLKSHYSEVMSARRPCDLNIRPSQSPSN